MTVQTAPTAHELIFDTYAGLAEGTGSRSPGMSAQTDIESDATDDDSSAGLAMFLIFCSAVLFVTGGVAVVALVGTWWMLGLAFGIHVLMTAVVVLTIVLVMDGRSRTTTRVRPRTPAMGG